MGQVRLLLWPSALDSPPHARVLHGERVGPLLHVRPYRSRLAPPGLFHVFWEALGHEAEQAVFD